MRSIKSLQRENIAIGKEATRRFREAMNVVTPGKFIQEISHEEFVARRNKLCSNFYQFRHTSKPMTKLEIQKLFKK